VTALTTDGGAPLLIGADGGCCNLLNGSIDEVAIYGAALSSGQITGHFGAGTGTSGCLGASTDPASANTCLSADVMSALSVTAPTSIAFGKIAPGEVSRALALVYVQKNTDADGYQLSVTRTAFTGGGGDLALVVSCATVTDASGTHCQAPFSSTGGDLEWDLPTPGVTPPESGWLFGPGISAPIGHRVSGATGTGAAADEWPARLDLHVPADAAPGHYSATVTFSTVVTTP
jgi:hypothetical protein